MHREVRPPQPNAQQLRQSQQHTYLHVNEFLLQPLNRPNVCHIDHNLQIKPNDLQISSFGSYRAEFYRFCRFTIQFTIYTLRQLYNRLSQN